MGFARKIFKSVSKVFTSLTGGLLGGMAAEKPKEQPVISTPTPTTSTAKSPAQIAADEEEERRKRLLALNAGGGTGQLTAAGGDTSAATVGRKTLLGQ